MMGKMGIIAAGCAAALLAGCVSNGGMGGAFTSAQNIGGGARGLDAFTSFSDFKKSIGPWLREYETVVVAPAMTPKNKRHDQARLNQWAAEAICAALTDDPAIRGMREHDVIRNLPTCGWIGAERLEGPAVVLRIEEAAEASVGDMLVSWGARSARLTYEDRATGEKLARLETPTLEQGQIVSYTVNHLEKLLLAANKPAEQKARKRWIARYEASRAEAGGYEAPCTGPN